MSAQDRLWNQFSQMRRKSGHLLPIALLAMLMMSGCATRTVGMQAPVAHDYDGMQWRPLDGPVSQRIVAAPGYTGLVENDPGTEPSDLGQRIERLPDDIRDSELAEIRIALRTVEGVAFDRQLVLEVDNLDGPGDSIRLGLDDLEFDGEWAILMILPPISAGDTVEVRLSPATGWEYGFTTDRIPYGGYLAMVGPESNQQSLQGALGFQTIFDQHTDVSVLLADDVWSALVTALTDPVLVAIYGIILGGFGSVIYVRRRRLETM